MNTIYLDHIHPRFPDANSSQTCLPCAPPYFMSSSPPPQCWSAGWLHLVQSCISNHGCCKFTSAMAVRSRRHYKPAIILDLWLLTIFPPLLPWLSLSLGGEGCEIRFLDLGPSLLNVPTSKSSSLICMLWFINISAIQTGLHIIFFVCLYIYIIMLVWACVHACVCVCRLEAIFLGCSLFACAWAQSSSF